MPQDICPLYKQMIGEMQRWRQRRRLTLRQLDDIAGIPDGLSSKATMLHRRTPRGASRPSGRVVGWQTMDEMLTALAGYGYRIVVLPPVTSPASRSASAPDPAQARLPLEPEATAEQLSLSL